jgi:hypothetical protein
METNEERIQRERKNAEREDELKRVPHRPEEIIDKKRWPRNVRAISFKELDGLGVDNDGRLYWNGKPVEIIGRRLDLTGYQILLATVVALFTVVGGIGAAVQGWTAYHDWACKNKQPAFLSCPADRQNLSIGRSSNAN